MEWFKIWPLAEKISQKSLNAVSGLKIDGCMHPLPQIDVCSCTRRTHDTNKGPVKSNGQILSHWKLGRHSVRSYLTQLLPILAAL